jgi:hypothetical protein
MANKIALVMGVKARMGYISLVLNNVLLIAKKMTKN